MSPAATPLKAVFCTQCGKRIGEVAACPHCGARNEFLSLAPPAVAWAQEGGPTFSFGGAAADAAANAVSDDRAPAAAATAEPPARSRAPAQQQQRPEEIPAEMGGSTFDFLSGGAAAVPPPPAKSKPSFAARSAPPPPAPPPPPPPPLDAPVGSNPDSDFFAVEAEPTVAAPGRRPAAPQAPPTPSRAVRSEEAGDAIEGNNTFDFLSAGAARSPTPPRGLPPAPVKGSSTELEAQPPPPPPEPASLLRLGPPHAGQSIALKPGANLIGTQDDNDIVLDKPNHKAVSRRHARLDATEERGAWSYVLTDLGSLNGTKLNGRKLEKDAPAALKEGDEIKLGNIAFRLEPRQS